MKIIVATHNEGKLVEIRRILEERLGAGAADAELVSAGSLNLPDPVEDGVTFQENALLKARDVAARTGCPAIADDSGPSRLLWKFRKKTFSKKTFENIWRLR